VVQDRLHSVRALVDRDGVWRASWRYDIYGNVLNQSGQLPFALRFRWAGAQWDEETGFYFMGSRYYYPGPGRFIQEDPIGLAGGVNLYAYADGDPTSARDPSGTAAEPMPESPSPYACLGTIRGCGDTSADGFFDAGGGGEGGLLDLDQNGIDDALDILIANYPFANRHSLLLIQQLVARNICTSATPCRSLNFDEYREAVFGGVASIGGDMRGLVATQLGAGRYLVSDARFAGGSSRNAVGTTLQIDGVYETWSFIRSDALVRGSSFNRQLPNALVHELFHVHGSSECGATLAANRFTNVQVAPPAGCASR
jgi:RHS repeat-associated protein